MRYIVLINLPRASRSFEVPEVKLYRSREFQKCGPAEVILDRQVKSIFNKNRAFSETSMKFGM